MSLIEIGLIALLLLPRRFSIEKSESGKGLSLTLQPLWLEMLERFVFTKKPISASKV